MKLPWLIVQNLSEEEEIGLLDLNLTRMNLRSDTQEKLPKPRCNPPMYAKVQSDMLG